MTLIPEGKNIFIIDLEYIVPIETVEPLLADHMAFINSCYDKGLFLASGPKVPRTGGVILAVSDSRKEVENLITEDPFHVHGAVKYTVTEFHARRTASA